MHPDDRDPASLAARLERLETAELAREATWRYATAVDTVDFDLLAAAFTEDAVLVTSKGERTGRDAVVDYYRTALATPVARRHFLMNQQVSSLERGRARVDSSFLYTYAGDDTSVIGWGSYLDHVRVIEGVGYIERKQIAVAVQADSRHGWAR